MVRCDETGFRGTQCTQEAGHFDDCTFEFPDGPTIWGAGTLRGEYDGDHDRIVCADCDWYDTGGPTGCGWRYHDHREEAHAQDAD